MQTHDTPRPAKTPIGRLLAELRARGITIAATGHGTVRVTAAREPLTPELQEKIRGRKDELLAALAAEASAFTAEQRERMRRAVTETLEAEPGQRYAWLSEHDADGDVVLAVAIRDVGTAELWISRERYEAFDLMQVLRAAEAPAA